MDNPSIRPPDPDQPPGEEPVSEPSPQETPPAESFTEQAAPPNPPVEEAASIPAQPEKKRRSFLQFLFGADSRLGRFNRAALRILATTLGLFALGLLAGYLLLFRPAQQELASAKADLAQSNGRLDSLQNDLNRAQQAQADLQKSNQDLAKQAESATRHTLLLQATNQANLARLFLAKNDPAGAEQALKDVPAMLLKLNPAVGAQNAELAKSIQARLNLVQTEIRSDPKTAASDLGILNDQFLDLEKKLAAGP